MWYQAVDIVRSYKLQWYKVLKVFNFAEAGRVEYERAEAHQPLALGWYTGIWSHTNKCLNESLHLQLFPIDNYEQLIVVPKNIKHKALSVWPSGRTMRSQVQISVKAKTQSDFFPSFPAVCVAAQTPPSLKND